MSLLIKNGKVVSEKLLQKADILIEDDKISKVSKKIKDDLSHEEVIDAEGMYVFPGFVDPHVHMSLPTPAGYSSDDFYTGSRAALFGGTTTIIDFVTPEHGQSIPEALNLRKKEAAGSIIDYSFHVTPVEFKEKTEQEILKCFDLGVKSLKVYMAYQDSIGLDDNDLLKVLEIVGKKKHGIVTVHCELDEEIKKLRETFSEEGKTQPLYHALSRPAHSESEAVKKLIQMAEKNDCPVYIVHVSTAKSLEHIEKAQRAGQEVHAETCPHYLLFDNSKYAGLFEDTAPFVVSPPLRKKFDTQELWKAVSNNTIKAIGTDHCPFMFSQKEKGREDFRKIPNGCGSIEHRPGLLYTYGVRSNKISVNQFANLLSTMPAKIFGLYPAKGVIAAGSDADLVIWDPAKEKVISADTHHQNCDINIYENIKTKGGPEYVLSKGKIAVRNDKIHEKGLKGSFVFQHKDIDED